jgi:hypothetical protein
MRSVVRRAQPLVVMAPKITTVSPKPATRNSAGRLANTKSSAIELEMCELRIDPTIATPRLVPIWRLVVAGGGNTGVAAWHPRHSGVRDGSVDHTLPDTEGQITRQHIHQRSIGVDPHRHQRTDANHGAGQQQ